MANKAYKQAYEHALQSILDGDNSTKNKKLVQEFDDFLRMQEIDYGARRHYFLFLILCPASLAGEKDFEMI
ncbi:MAG TPA: hypothetical protein VFF13_03325 [archaeon]|nr:hypothetical protein [archaeon]